MLSDQVSSISVACEPVSGARQAVPGEGLPASSSAAPADRLAGGSEAFMPVFEEILDWQLAVVRRHSEACLCVMVLAPQQTAGLPQAQRQHAMEDFYRTLRRSTRAADLAAHGRNGEVWLLLPHSDAQGARARLERLLALEGLPVVIHIAAVDVRHGEVFPDSAVQLMGDLRHALS